MAVGLVLFDPVLQREVLALIVDISSVDAYYQPFHYLDLYSINLPFLHRCSHNIL